MTEPLIDTLLLTGAGGDIALSIARFMRGAGMARRIIGADARSLDDSSLYDARKELPRADNPAFLDVFRSLAQEATLVAPLPDAELARLLDERIIPGPCLLTANSLALEIGLDKWRTFERLSLAGIPTPCTGILDESTPESFPVIVKPRRGQGGKGVILIQSDALDRMTAERPNDLWQEWLPDDREEYTCGLFRVPGVPLRTIVFRRTLVGGLTGTATTVEDMAIDSVLAKIADTLDLSGSINVQLRKHEGIPFVFEINPRFSSTVGFRDMLGFRDFLWAAEFALGQDVSGYEPPASGIELRREGRAIVKMR